MNSTQKNTEEDLKQNNQSNRLYCEYFQEWRDLKEGCKNLKEYCPYRNQCIIYFYSKVKEESI